jgi:hypothetical protein
MTNNMTRLLMAIAGVGLLSACTAGQGAVEPPVTVAAGGNITSPSYSSLQFSAGVANIAGQIGVNIATTLRQPNGLSALGSDAPSITWDGAFVNAGAGTGSIDAGKAQYSGTLPPNPAGSSTAPVSTFGTTWGIFDVGLLPANSSATGTTISSPCTPFSNGSKYKPTLTAANLGAGEGACSVGAQIYGGPPAFPNVRGAALTGQIGAFLGINAFMGETPAVNASTGQLKFTLNVSIPTSPVSSLPAATATVKNVGATAIGTWTTPPTFTTDGSGGGLISYTLPAGVTEAYLVVIDWGPDPGNSPNCNYGGSPPFYYTLEVTAASPNPIQLPDSLGAVPPVGSLPTGKSTHSICTSADNTAAAAAGIPITNNGGTAVAAGSPSVGDQVQVIGIGFDYPAYEAMNAAGLKLQTPTLVGANGQSDLTMSDLSAYFSE